MIFCADSAEEATEATEEDEEDDLEKMELLSASRGGRRSFSERKLISDFSGHGTPQKELLHFDQSQFDQGKVYKR